MLPSNLCLLNMVSFTKYAGIFVGWPSCSLHHSWNTLNHGEHMLKLKDKHHDYTTCYLYTHVYIYIILTYFHIYIHLTHMIHMYSNIFVETFPPLAFFPMETISRSFWKFANGTGSLGSILVWHEMIIRSSKKMRVVGGMVEKIVRWMVK